MRSKCFTKRLFEVAAIVVVIFRLTANADAQAGRNPVTFVPDKMPVVMRVNWPRVRPNPELSRIVDGGKIPGALASIGIDADKVSEYISFMNLDPTSAQKVGAIIVGRFRAGSVARTAREKNWKEVRFGRFKAFESKPDEAVMELAPGIVAAGTPTAVEAVAQVALGKRRSVARSEPFASVWKEVRGANGPIGLYLGIPGEYDLVAGLAFKLMNKVLNLASFGIVGTIFDTIGLIRSLGASISNTADGFPMRIVTVMDGELKAMIAAGALTLLQKAPDALGVGTGSTEQDLRFRLVKSMRTSARGAMLSVNFFLPKELSLGAQIDGQTQRNKK